MSFLEASAAFQHMCEASQDKALICTKEEEGFEAQSKLLHSQLIAVQMHTRAHEDEMSALDRNLVALSAELQGVQDLVCGVSVGFNTKPTTMQFSSICASWPSWNMSIGYTSLEYLDQ